MDTHASVLDTPGDEGKNEPIIHNESAPGEPIDTSADGIVRKQLAAVDAGVQVQLKSKLDQLSWKEALWTFRKTVLICAVAGFCASTDGYQNQLTSSVVANKGFIYKIAADHKVINPTYVSTFGGLFSAGQVIGQFSIQWISDLFGRKAALWTFTAILTIAIIIEVTTATWYQWTIAKLIAGIGVGSVQASLPVYINEQAVPQVRGMLIVAYSAWFSIGSLMASVGLTVNNNNDPYNWKTPLYTQFAMVGISAIIFVFLPESPWWLVSKGKNEQARKILESKNGSVEGYDVELELAIIAATIEKQKLWDREAKAEGQFAILKGLNLKRFLIGSWPKVLQQFVGLSVFSNYQTYFFQISGFSNSFQITVIASCISLIAVFLDAVLVDYIGRRRMTLIGFGGACSGVLIMAIVGCFDYNQPSIGAVLVFADVWANFFNTFQSSTSYAYLTETPQLRFRAKSTGWGLAWCNCWAVMFSFCVPLMLKKWNVKSTWLFVCLGLPGTVLAYFIMPETSRRSPAEIEELFVDRVPLRRWKGYETAVERDLAERIEQHEI